jgi:hypothetical protein
VVLIPVSRKARCTLKLFCEAAVKTHPRIRTKMGIGCVAPGQLETQRIHLSVTTNPSQRLRARLFRRRHHILAHPGRLRIHCSRPVRSQPHAKRPVSRRVNVIDLLCAWSASRRQAARQCSR